MPNDKRCISITGCVCSQEQQGEVQVSFILQQVKETGVDEIPLKFLCMNYRMDLKSVNIHKYLCCLSVLVL